MGFFLSLCLIYKDATTRCKTIGGQVVEVNARAKKNGKIGEGKENGKSEQNADVVSDHRGERALDKRSVEEQSAVSALCLISGGYSSHQKVQCDSKSPRVLI